jgi:hypothetical protein
MIHRNVYPTTLSEIAAMSACYALVALLAWMVIRPDTVGAFLRGLVS